MSDDDTTAERDRVAEDVAFLRDWGRHFAAAGSSAAVRVLRVLDHLDRVEALAAELELALAARDLAEGLAAPVPVADQDEAA
jgi:hypothetical protein